MDLYAFIGSFRDPISHGMNLSALPLNNAYLVATNNRNTASYIYERDKECINCPYNLKGFTFTQSIYRISSEKQYKILLKTSHDVIDESDVNIICQLAPKFGEFGIYQVIITDKNCTEETVREPINIYLPVLTVTFIYFIIFMLVILLRSLKFFKNVKNEISNKEIDVSLSEKERIKSLDALRGVVIMLMVFINYGYGGYICLRHVVWYGMHLADLLYPLFLWIMGVCIPISMQSRIKIDDSKSKALRHIAKRTCIIYGLGIFIGSGAYLYKLRILGILQRLAICYFVHALLCFFILRKQKFYRNRLNGPYGDIARLKYSWLLMMILLILHTLVVSLVPFKHCPRGYFGPGGRHENFKYLNCTAGIAGHIDRIVLRRGIQNYYTRAADVYHAQQFDAEGILGTLTALVHVCLGVQAGFTLLTYKDDKSRIIRWIIWGVILALIGGCLCDFSFSGGVIPLVRHLWTLSFVLVTTGLGFLLLCFFYILVDVKKVWTGKPFTYLGMNSILVYVGHYLTNDRFPFTFFLEGQVTHFTKLLANTTGTICWVIIAYYLYRKKMFLKI